jgi:hypothetical protein
MTNNGKLLCLSLGIGLIFSLLYPTKVFAGGGEQLPTSTPVTTPQIQSGNTPVTTSPVTGGSSSGQGNTVVNGSNGLGGTVTQISPIAPLQSNSSFYSNTTQYSTSGVNSSCGLSVGIGANNSNTGLETIYTADVRYNTNPCPNYTKLKQLEQEGETKRVKMYVQGNVIRDCANFRTQLIQAGKNPDAACKVPDLSQMDSLMH